MKEQMYKQVTVKKNDLEVTTWVEEELAFVGKRVYIESGEVKDHGREVIEVYSTAQTKAQLGKTRTARKGLASITTGGS